MNNQQKAPFMIFRTACRVNYVCFKQIHPLTNKYRSTTCHVVEERQRDERKTSHVPLCARVRVSKLFCSWVATLRFGRGGRMDLNEFFME